MEKAPIICVAQEGKCKASCRAPTGVAGGHWLAAKGFSTPSQELRRRA